MAIRWLVHTKKMLSLKSRVFTLVMHVACTNYIKQLASNYDYSVWTIYRHKARVEARMPPRRALSGPRRVITWPIEQAIKQLLDQRL